MASEMVAEFFVYFGVFRGEATNRRATAELLVTVRVDYDTLSNLETS